MDLTSPVQIVTLLMCAQAAAPVHAGEEARAAPAPAPITASPTQAVSPSVTRPQWPEISRLPLTINERTDGPQGAFPPSPPKDEPRTVSAALSLGPGWLALRDAVGRDGQPALGFAGRLGFVVAPEWNLVLGADRTRAQRGGATFSQTAGLLGLQRFFLGRIYVGGALGLAWVKESGVPDSLSDGPGYAFSGSIGLEVVKTSHAALTTEVTVTIAQYSREKWEMGGIRLGFVVF